MITFKVSSTAGTFFKDVNMPVAEHWEAAYVAKHEVEEEFKCTVHSIIIHRIDGEVPHWRQYEAD